jgi:flagellar biosynthesis/type III secretory pathway chaperone
MSYTNRIQMLEESIKIVDGRIETLRPGEDAAALAGVTSQKVTLLSELSRLRKLQFEEDHERVNLDDE